LSFPANEQESFNSDTLLLVFVRGFFIRGYQQTEQAIPLLQLVLNPSELTWDDTLADTLHKPIQITSHSLHVALSCHSENTQMIYNKIEVTRYFQSINMSVKTNFKAF